jgi:hypothetical protein
VLTGCLTVSALLSGCGQATGPSKIIVVAASATANEPAPVLAAPDRALLHDAGATSTRGDAYVVDPNTSEPTEVVLTPRRADGQVEYGPDRSRLLTANIGRVQRLLDRLAADRPFDLLAWLAQAVRVTAQPATLLVLSSGLSTSGALDLRQVGWGANPHAVAVKLRRRGLLPSLAGWRVVFSGLGDTGGRQPTLPLPQWAKLTAYWLAICHAAGAASCTTDPITRPSPPSHSRTPVSVVHVPRIVPIHGPRGQQGASLPADEFFGFDSSRLLPGADHTLGPLARRAENHHLNVSIAGYASPDGGTHDYNIHLSTARARAVQARLIALGVPASQIVKVTGLGTGGRQRSACLRHRHVDETVCGQFRRVVIILNPAPGGHS